MIDRILCARDFSPASNRALGYALEIAERTGADLHLMYVEEISLGFFSGDPSPAPGRKKLQRQFEERCQDDLPAPSFAPDEDRVSIVTTRSGAVAPALVTYASENDIDLVVMGTQGRRGVERAFFGSVAEEVLRTAPCPVLTTRAPESESEGPQRPEPIDQVVVPIDFSDPSRAALRYASQFAAVYSVPLTLLHVVSLPKLPAAYGIEYSEQLDLLTKAKSEIEKWNTEIVPDEQESSCIVTSGNPASSILDAASTPGDLIVMATRGISGLSRAMLGSVAEGVLRDAPGPVLSSRAFPSPSD
jgi:nucleotide-binding universal stress UspA family protein